MTLHWRLIFTVVLFFWVWFYTPNVDQALRADEGKPITVVVAPRVTMNPPKQARIKARITPHEGNREFCYIWSVNQGFPNRSCFELQGADTPITFPDRYITLREAGEWTVGAAIRRNDGKWYLAVETVEVRGME